MPKGSGGGGGGTAHIDVYARVRPSKKPSRHLEIDYAEHAIAMKLERKREEAVVNNQRENYSFAFSRVLDMSTTQDTVFETVARPVVDSVLDGYNGTIFAYGQTGSGKTFTITGGAERYVDRGIIPRALSYIFGRLAEQRSEYTYERRRATLSAAQFSAAQFAAQFGEGPLPLLRRRYEVRISYLEIYLEAGYDLLDPSHETKGLEDLPKVTMQEDEDGRHVTPHLTPHIPPSAGDDAGG